jgi:hypothetical protein
MTRDPVERALAVSPNLYSISVKEVCRDKRRTEPTDPPNHGALLGAISHAPNLKHVQVTGCIHPWSPTESHIGNPRQPWKDFIPPIEGSPKRKQLETLVFKGYDSFLTRPRLDVWETEADFSRLKVFGCSISDEHLVDNFLATLSPLQSLTLSEKLNDSIIDNVTARHGPTLRELNLRPSGAIGLDWRITAPHIDMIASRCPNIVSMTLVLQRSMGDRIETQCYEALGSLRRLKKLQLNLNCTNPDFRELQNPPEDWDDFDKATQTPAEESPKWYNGYLKRAIVNAALDEHLVRAIWDAINENRDQGSGLEELGVCTFGGSRFGSRNLDPNDMVKINSHVSRSYLVKPNSRVEGGLDIVELTKKKRKNKDITFSISGRSGIGIGGPCGGVGRCRELIAMRNRADALCERLYGTRNCVYKLKSTRTRVQQVVQISHT